MRRVHAREKCTQPPRRCIKVDNLLSVQRQTRQLYNGVITHYNNIMLLVARVADYAPPPAVSWFIFLLCTSLAATESLSDFCPPNIIAGA